MSFYLVYFCVGLVLVSGAAYAVYRLAGRLHPGLGVTASALTLLGLGLLFPVPIGHGTLSLGEMLYHEWFREWSKAGKAVVTERRQPVDGRRFAGVADFSVRESLFGNWQVVTVAGEPVIEAFHDGESGMLFSGWLRATTGGDLLSLDQAKSRCKRLQSNGNWDLISDAESYLLWKSEWRERLYAAPESSVAQLIDDRMGLALPVYRLRGNADNRPRAESGARDFVFRCVARTEKAPVGGYSSNAIPRDEWNRYQLGK
jgi:hypothetical protein